MIHAVIFNLDGILVSSDECHYQAWRQLAHEQGIRLTPELYQKMGGMKRLDSLNALLSKAERTYSPAETWALSARKNDLFNELIDRLNQESILPGTFETLRALRDMGMKAAVASSSENAGGILRQLKIYHLFDAVVDGCMIENGKPDPEVFLLTARKLKMPTSDCLVVENTEAGIEAARQAGMRCVTVGSRFYGTEEIGVPETLAELDLPSLLKRQED